jgi:predicted phosphodiesterase
LKTTLIISDCHHPSVDRKAWELLLKVGKSQKIDTVVIIGDFGDFASVTSHAKNSHQRSIMLADELFACNEALHDLEEIKAKDHIFVMGNHEDRLSRYISERCPELHGLYGTDVQSALRLRERGYEIVPYRSHIYRDGIYYTHDTGSAGLNAHRTSLQKYQRNVVIGHTHRMGYETKRTINGQVITGFMCGWLGDAALCAGYMHSSSATTDWTIGFGMAYSDGINAHIAPVVIQEDYSCVVGGKHYK